MHAKRTALILGAAVGLVLVAGTREIRGIGIPDARLSAAAAVAEDQDKEGRVRQPPKADGQPKADAPRAVPREEPRAKPGSRDDRPGKQSDRQRTAAPRRGEVPHRYFSLPHEYAFPPVDIRLGFYYHPYFGFYYGPYYGPYYPFPGPFPRPTRYGASSVRLRVQPVATEVYVNGYYAGIADDFDGVFQRLYLPTGGHHLELRLEGYESYARDIYASPGDTSEIQHRMVPLRAGLRTTPPPRPRALPDEWATADETENAGQPDSPYGVLAIRTEPADAQILIDGEAWAAVAGQQEFVIHLPEGWHRLEVRKDSYRPFTTSVDLAPGHVTRLAVRLEP
jgi:hypothetical protein